jgi:phage gp29-like protein
MFNCRSYTKPSRCPRLVHDTTEAEDMKLFSDSLPGLVSTGVQIPVSWVHDKLQIPVPKDGEAVLGIVAVEEKKEAAAPDEKPVKKAGKTKETKPQAKLKNMAITKLAALKTKADQAQNKDTTDLFTHQLTDGFSPILQGFNDDIEALINGATSLEELQEQLNTMDLSIDEASEVLQLALVASELGGMADVEDGQ